MRRLLLFLIGVLWWIVAQAGTPTAITCTGRFPNPITDVCWSCVLPFVIGAVPVWQGGQEDSYWNNPASPVCMCPGWPPRVGLTIGFWEPVRQVDVVRKPFCFPALGGVQLSGSMGPPEGVQHSRVGMGHSGSFYQAHYYINPVLYWLRGQGEHPCMEQGGFDIAYMTELDPLWNDDELTTIINPDAILFANPIAVLSCAIDCVAATIGFGNPAQFWCGGCQGGIYPLDGHVAVHTGGVASSELIAHKLTAKLHRQGMALAYHGWPGLCGGYILPIMYKSAYKLQMSYPIPNTLKIDGHCCQPFGRTTQIWGAGKEFPTRGEDFAYFIFRKRNCCLTYY